jgi:hypothetical protein
MFELRVEPGAPYRVVNPGVGRKAALHEEK